MAQILQKVNKKHASDDVKCYALYAYYFLERNKTQISKMYHKSVSTIANWISYYENTGSLVRPSRIGIPTKFDEEKRQWLLNLYHENPVLYLDEAKYQFQIQFNTTISTSHICRILHDNNMSWKTLEKRAIQIKDFQIFKFMAELDSFDWDYSNLVFLDEVSIDNQGLLRTKGYGIVGEKLIYRGEFSRKPRMSMLAFLGQNGILDTYVTEGTFNRLKFLTIARTSRCQEIVKSILATTRCGLWMVQKFIAIRVSCAISDRLESFQYFYLRTHRFSTRSNTFLVMSKNISNESRQEAETTWKHWSMKNLQK